MIDISGIITPESRFQYAVNVVLKHEGGLSDHPRDPGGVTKYGVSIRFLEAIGLDIDGDGDIDRNDVIALTRPKAIEIYRAEWWDKYRYEALNNLLIATKIFDTAVNTGAKRAHKIAQISINRLSDKPLAVDGILGAKTMAAINYFEIKGWRSKLLYELRETQRHFYINLVADKPTLKVFEKGWLARASS